MHLLPDCNFFYHFAPARQSLVGEMFLQIEKMYFWLRSATSNIHEAIPQTGSWGEGGSMLQTPSIPQPSIIHQPLNASENCLNIHHSNLAGAGGYGY